MPSKLPIVVAFRGDDAYARGLARLVRAARAAGVAVDTPHQLAEYTLAEYARVVGVRLPPRARPVGTNQHGEPG